MTFVLIHISCEPTVVGVTIGVFFSSWRLVEIAYGALHLVEWYGKSPTGDCSSRGHTEYSIPSYSSR